MLEEFKQQAKDDQRFFSNSGQFDQEKSVVAAFLRCLNVSFETSELMKNENDPPDVIFRDSNFEVTEVLAPNRKRGDEFKRKKQILDESKSIDEYLDKVETGYIHPQSMSREELTAIVEQKVNDKFLKYKDRQINSGELDLLIYINLGKRIGNEESSAKFKIEYNGFRSVSVLIGEKGIIFKGPIPSIEKEPYLAYTFTGNIDFFWKIN